MRVINATILLVLSFSLSVSAQSFDVNFYETVDLYNGIDPSFYSGSNFGVKNPIYSAYPVNGMIRHNRVDGLFLGYQEDKMDWNNSHFLGIENVDLNGMIGYSVAQKEVQYAIGAEKSIGYYRKWLLLGGNFYRSTSTEDYWRSGVYENSLTSFTTGFDFHDYYHAEGYAFYSLLKPLRFLELGASYNWNTFSSVQASTDFSLISRYATYRFNPAIDANSDRINQESLTLGATINPKGVAKNSMLWATLSIQAELADIGQTTNDFMYNRYQFEAKTYFRLDRSTLLKWRLLAGSITGEAPDFKNFALGGIGSMRALGYKSLVGNEMLLSNLEIELGKSSHHNNNWVDLSSMSVSFFLDSGVSEFNTNYYSTQNPFSNYSLSFPDLSHNLGMGIGMGMLRFEISKPVAGVQGQTSFWIRLNPTF